MSTRADPDAQAIYDLLRERSSELATRIIADVARAIGGIEQLTPEDTITFHGWAKVVLETIVDIGRDGSLPGDFALVLDERARARAREGREIGKALTAYAIGARALVDELAAIAEAQPDHRAATATVMMKILPAVEVIQSRFVEAYEHERAEMERASGVDEQRFLRDLIDGTVPYASLAERARALQVPDPPYQLLRVWAGRRDDDPAMRVAAMRIDCLGDTWHLALPNGSELVVISSIRPGFIDRAQRFCVAIEEALNLRPTIAISNPFTNMSRAYDAYRDAGAALLYALARQTGGVMTAGQALHARWLAESPAIRRQIIEETLRDVAHKEELLATLTAYVEHGPNLQVVADRIFAHANTVTYRLNKVKELTGRDPRQPVDLSELCLALLALGIEVLVKTDETIFPA